MSERWTIYVCPGCGAVCQHGAAKCIAHGLVPLDPEKAVGYPEAVEVAPASEFDALQAENQRLREALPTEDDCERLCEIAALIANTEGIIDREGRDADYLRRLSKRARAALAPDQGEGVTAPDCQGKD